MSTSHHEHSGTAPMPVLDSERLAMLMEIDEGDTSMIKEIVAQFVVDINGVLPRIDTAICTGNYSQIASVAHTIKGSSGTFGLHQVESISRELETCCKDATKHDLIPAIYDSLREAFDAGCAALDAYFKGK